VRELDEDAGARCGNADEHPDDRRLRRRRIRILKRFARERA
jgi:hypothetical protein